MRIALDRSSDGGSHVRCERQEKIPRIEINKDVYCYVEGARLDACSQNISKGGMFLKTDSARDIPLDALVGLVFRSSETGMQTTFVFGRVVRKQEMPVEGVGLHWEKAVTPGSADQLIQFLKRMFDIDRPLIREESGDAGRPAKRIFDFSSLERSTPGGRPAIEAGPQATPADRQKGLRVNADDSDLQKVQLIRSEKTPPPAVRWVAPNHVQQGNPMPRDNTPGAITGMVHRSELRAPASQKVMVSIGGQDSVLKLSNLGMDGMFVESPFAPTDLSQAIKVMFEIRTKKGGAPIVCHCRILRVDDGTATGTAGMDLAIEKLEEGDNKGILKRYIKWLHFQALSK